jgi:signal transduction histidine kinase
MASRQLSHGDQDPRQSQANTGPVIPASQVTRLLQPFQRLPATRPADDQGLGLGLPVVAAIAKAHHATLTINPRPHGGLDIAITFPPATEIAASWQATLATA